MTTYVYCHIREDTKQAIEKNRLAHLRKTSLGSNHKPILCVETQEHFNSLSEAAKVKKINKSNISKALKTNIKAGKLTWRYVS